MGNQLTTLRMEQRFKKTPAGEIPIDWDAREIKSLAKVLLNGGTPDTKIGQYWHGDIPWITGADFSNQKVANIRRHISQEAVKNSATNIVPKGALLIVTRTGVGKLAIAPFDIAISQDITGMIPKADSVLPEFLFWALNLYVPQLKASHQGTSINGILRDDLERFMVPVPPLREQKKIAEILSAVDESIKKTNAIIDKVRGLKQSLMQQLFTKGVAGHKKYKTTEIGRMPESWNVISLEKLASIERGKFQHRPRNEPRFYGGQYPFVQTGDVTNAGGWLQKYTQTLNEAGLAISKLFPKGTILITIAANIGETAIAEFDVAFPDSLIGIVANKNIDNRFLEYYLRTRKDHLNSLAAQSAQKNINLETLRPYLVPVPPENEQIAIADILDTVAQEELNEAKVFNALGALKSALMKMLLTGKVRVKPYAI